MKKVLSLMSFLLVQCSLFASEPIDLHGCWSVSHYIAYDCVTEEDSIPHTVEITANAFSKSAEAAITAAGGSAVKQ